MFDDTVPENSFHRSSVNESNNDEMKMEIAIRSPNRIHKDQIALSFQEDL